jgi:Malate synthase
MNSCRRKIKSTKNYEEYQVSESDLIEIPKGTITEKGVRKNINVGILYIESWLMGVGAAALYNFNGRRCNGRNFEDPSLAMAEK